MNTWLYRIGLNKAIGSHIFAFSHPLRCDVIRLKYHYVKKNHTLSLFKNSRRSGSFEKPFFFILGSLTGYVLCFYSYTKYFSNENGYLKKSNSTDSNTVDRIGMNDISLTSPSKYSKDDFLNLNNFGQLFNNKSYPILKKLEYLFGRFKNKSVINKFCRSDNNANSLDNNKKNHLKISHEGDSGYLVEYNENATDIKIVSGSSNPELAQEVCTHLGISLGRVKLGRFADGEITLQILDEVRGQDVFVMQSAPCASSNICPNTSIMELCLMISAIKRASAKYVTAILPYASYFREPNKSEGISPHFGSDIARILIAMGADRLVFIDNHTTRIEGLMPESIPITNIPPHNLFVEYYKRKKNLDKSIVLVATHNSSVERAEAFRNCFIEAGFDAKMATMITSSNQRRIRGHNILDSDIDVYLDSLKTQSSDNKILYDKINEKYNQWLVGDVADKDCIIVDDIIDTGHRAVLTAYILKLAGARRIFMFATHGLFSKGSINRIIKSPIEEVVTTNSIKLHESLFCDKHRVISISKLLAEVISRIHHKQPLSTLHSENEKLEYHKISSV